MPVYEYIALDKRGRNKKGIIDADSPMAARQKLRDGELFPVNIMESESRPKELSSSQVPLSNIFRRVRSMELSVMTRQLSTLLGAGIPLVTSLESLISQTDNPLLKRIIAQVKEGVNEGKSLASCLEQYPVQFSDVYVNMVRSGEESGSLDLVLNQLAELSERQEDLKNRIRSALAYPVFMILIGTSVLFILMAFVMPDIIRIFDDMRQTLPLPTLILISISEFMKSFWWLLLLIIVISIITIRQFFKTQSGRKIWDLMKISSPVFGSINIRIALARFGSTLGSLLQSGVPLLQSLKIVRNIVNNSYIAWAVDLAMEDIEAGKTIASPLSKSRWIPAMAIQMIAVGEQSGELEKMLYKIADIYEKEVQSRVIALTSMLEPVMILLMALIIGFIAVSILFPIFEMSQMIR